MSLQLVSACARNERIMLVLLCHQHAIKAPIDGTADMCHGTREAASGNIKPIYSSWSSTRRYNAGKYVRTLQLHHDLLVE